MMSVDKGSTPPEVVLGFLEEAKQWRLLPPQFPSKVGGRPAWLSQRNLPSPPELECDVCRLPMAFLLQVSGNEITLNYGYPLTYMLNIPWSLWSSFKLVSVSIETGVVNFYYYSYMIKSITKFQDC